jgi:hypothetical protein
LSGPPEASGFAQHWAKHRLAGRASTFETTDERALKSSVGRTLGQVIAAARNQIAEAAGVPIDAVKISIELS